MVRNLKARGILPPLLSVSVFLLFSCGGEVFNTVFPKELQYSDTLVSVSKYLEDLKDRKDDEYSVKLKSLSMESGAEYVVLLVDFISRDFKDSLMVFSSSLKYLTQYRMRDLLDTQAEYYDFASLLGSGTGDRILVGLRHFEDGSGKVAALDPAGKAAPVVQDNPSAYGHFDYDCAFVINSMNMLFTAAAPNLLTGGMDASFVPIDMDTSSAATAKALQVFQYASEGFVLADASYCSGDSVLGLILRASDNRGYVVLAPLDSENTAPLVGSSRYFSFFDLHDSNELFYTRGGIVRAGDEGQWHIIKLDGTKVEGPKLESWDALRAKYFSAGGSFYYYYNDVKMNLGRAKTWW